MIPSFKKRFWRLVKWFAALFIVLYVLRLLYGYLAADSTGPDYSSDFFSNVEKLRKNYASEKISLNTHVPQQAPQSSNLKYEKTATVRSKTSQFETDEGAVRKATKEFSAVIQYEQNLGNKGNRELHLLIGVAPASFDRFYQAIQKIGNIKATEITKIDKTNEYRTLNAKKVSLETTLASLNELKTKSGQIGDYVTLHDKILEIETQLQELGVELGDFDTENEFCTVRFSLYEGATEKKIGIASSAKVAFEWTVKYYALIVFTLLGLSCLVFLLLVIIDKLNIGRFVSGKLNE
ncbi:MAG: DUF4349 domain-containing protein [Williamsia sp.]|nr:DUF4349 domain-containing protein [Williamsia sp.]